ncbi:MAG: hypothetical protein Q7V05_15330 [Methanoregula sp.]|nr:hypothetical protein [Methanoregula sp.]
MAAYKSEITPAFFAARQYHNYRFMENLPVKPAFFPARAAPVLNFPAPAQSGQLLSP